MTIEKPTTHPNEIQMIVESLYKKSKRSFKRRKKDLINQAKHISPNYRSFIHKIIKNSSLKIVTTYDGGFIIPNEELIETNTLQRRQKNKIYTDIEEPYILPHELGHAADFWFGKLQSLSVNVILSTGMTLKQTFDEEFNLKHKEIHQVVMDEYKNIINSNINEGAYDLFINNLELYNKLSHIPIDYRNKEYMRKRKQIQTQLYENGFVEVYYNIYIKNCYQILNAKYGPVLDALSSRYDFEGLFLNYHPFFYYQLDDDRPVYEFFANLFEAKVTSKHLRFDNLRDLLPKSLEAFEELFAIFYNHIQQNKRFTDVKLIKEINNAYLS